MGGADSRTADAINWIFCRSSAALRGWPLAYRSQLKLMYGDHHQQPQKDCCYDEPDPFLVVREPCMRMIGPVHGQPTFHAAPNPTPYHTSYGLMTEHQGGRPWRRAILQLAASLRLPALGFGRGCPWLFQARLGARLFGLSQSSPWQRAMLPLRPVRLEPLLEDWPWGAPGCKPELGALPVAYLRRT